MMSFVCARSSSFSEHLVDGYASLAKVYLFWNLLGQHIICKALLAILLIHHSKGRYFDHVDQFGDESATKFVTTGKSAV